MLHSSVTLSRSTYALTWLAEKIGDQHEALFVLPDTAEPDRLIASTRRAGDELGRAGLFDARRGVHPDLVHTFRALARPDIDLYGTIAHQHHPEPMSIVAAAESGSAVLAVLDATTLTLHPIRPDSVADAVLGLLPPTQPAHGQSLSVPASAVQGAAGRHASEDEEFSVFAGQGRTDPSVARLRQLVAQPRSSAAQIHVAVRDQLGRRRRSEFPVHVIDVDSGRWFLHRRRNTAGDVWITAAPATTAAVAKTLADVCRVLTAAR
ncbi:ESX secretion-associated protein EspG [Kutzneria buriramensis]|uniref:ESAT-6 protein secretion system EspG family protein n=1 Tax=Kutzneria buriramensis TaxID=1045776 RepID=A0A3E0HPF6_9PSEU|nr:ESX secretion-associated protein EspG [Kutzneria buriramensis]REH48287.1 ESAT-6 protein secretion system EspG family protein [Kutzneria buriramensis]